MEFMLIDFTVKNYRSFKEAATLSLAAQPLKNDGIAIYSTEFGHKILPAAGIYGANASGKSNILKGLSYAILAVLNSNNAAFPITKHPLLQPFMLDRQTQKEPVHFEISLWDKEQISQYNYAFQVHGDAIVTEWLEVIDRPSKKRRSRIIFERENNTFTFHPTEGERLKRLKGFVANTALALNVFANFADSYSRRVVTILQNINFVDANNMSSLMMYALERLHDDEKLKSQVVNFIRNSDIGIQDISIDRSEMNLGEAWAQLPKELQGIPILNTAPGYRYELYSRHSIYGAEGSKQKEEKTFHFGDESRGTNKLLSLSVLLFEALNEGKTVLIDELGSGLHPHLTRKIVELFQSPVSNRFGAQLVFAGHDVLLMETNSLNRTLDLRRDQIWFTEKGEDESSEMRCLVEYKSKKEHEFAKRYLEGRFGAVPMFSFENA